MGDLIDTLLDFSQIETGIVKYRRELFNLTKTLWFLKNIFIREMSEESKKKTDFRFDIHFNVKEQNNIDDEIYAWGDVLRFEQIIINLVTNALKYTEKGKVTVDIFVEKISAISKFIDIRIEVADTGLGISEGELPNIYLPD